MINITVGAEVSEVEQHRTLQKPNERSVFLNIININSRSQKFDYDFLPNNGLRVAIEEQILVNILKYDYQ